MRKTHFGFVFLAMSVGAACSGTESSTASSGGTNASTGGSAAQGGASVGGNSSNSGGMTSSGGTSGVGGTSSSGGANATGGASNTGGASSTGGAGNTGGAPTGGASSTGGSRSTGGTTSTVGGSATGGRANGTGGAATGGGASSGGAVATGGKSNTGGAASTGGAAPTGGAKATGGVSATGGAKATGGSSGNCPTPNPNLFAMGADISQVPQDESGSQTRYVDTDGQQKDILAILKNHGFNYIRLRTFVDPTASDGYSAQGYCDLTHTIALAKRVKQACMGFLLDFHYSDNWADPGKQCIPVAWQGMTLAQMTQQVHDYTYNSVQALVNAGARPDIVQVGNEITPGMLIHICNSSGTPTSTNSVNGSTSNWANLAGFLNAGIKGVHDVDSSIKIMLHIERGGDANATQSWLYGALSHNVAFDVFAESTYVKYQGQPSVWQSTFDTLMNNPDYASLRFASAEYNNEAVTSPAGTTSMRAINDTIYNMANNRGFGTFFWEPTRYGDFGNGLFTWSGANCTAISSAFAVYDQMRTAYASRL